MNERQTILLVDDNENDLLLGRVAFKKADFGNPLQEVHNGQEAIAYLEGEGQYSDRKKFPLPAAMLLDLNMPMKNGFDVLSWRSKQPAFKRLPIIMAGRSSPASAISAVNRPSACLWQIPRTGKHG